MKGKKLLLVVLLGLALLLITACKESTDMGPTSTPNPLTMTIFERTIWDFDNYRNKVNDMAAEAADMAPEDLDPIIWEMNALAEEIKEYEVPLFAVKAQSALYNYANSTFQCYSDKFSVYFRESIGAEPLDPSNFDYCDEAPIFGESVDLLLQELKEMNAKK